jgi:hypothetical protein
MKKSALIAIIGIFVIIVLFVIVISVFLVSNLRTTSSLPPTLDLNTAIADIVSSFTATPTQPTNTPTEELTSTPHASRTPLPTWTITMTPSPFPTRTPQPSITPTGASSKPGQGLGDPTWIDDFDNDNNWTLFDDECFKTEISGGRYIQTTKGAPAGACWEVTWPRIQDFYLETVSYVPSSCEERDRYGIFFRGLDTKRGYLFGITCKGEYWLSFWNSATNRRELLIDYTENKRISTGAGSTNILAIQTSGDRILLYANNTLLAEVYDSTYTQEGLFGLFIASEVTEAFTVRYNYLAYWSNP